jgi:ferredoxin
MSAIKPKIFISYRREDSCDIVGRIADHLMMTFGDESVFFDVVNIPGGANFLLQIEEAIAGADIFLAVIGDHWVQRIERTAAPAPPANPDKKDYVLLEVQTALKAEVAMIPVLVGSAAMPDLSCLPENIAKLATFNAACVRSGADFRDHMRKLIDGIQAAFQAAMDSDDVIVTVRYRRSGRIIRLKNPAKNLLEIAEENGIHIDYGCRAGACGTCMTAVVSGQVEYCTEPRCSPPPSSCLTCIARPVTNVELDA